MKTLLHICCAPCANRPIDILRTDGMELVGFWYNPNIHPVTEYRARRNCLEAYARQIELLPRSFSIDIPQELVHTIHSHADDAAYCYEAGREWCSAQCKDLLKHGVPAIHFYTMGRQDNVTSILRDNF